MSALPEHDIRRLCSKLLTQGADGGDGETLAADGELLSEVRSRLERCGVRLLIRPGKAPVCAVDDHDELPELPLACLALCAVALGDSQPGKRPRISTLELWERVGRGRGYSHAYVRRAGLGPLESRGLVRVVKPGQRANDAYVVAGPALDAVDRRTLITRLKNTGLAVSMAHTGTSEEDADTAA